MPDPIKKGRKKKARNIRKDAHHVEGQKKGTTSTHLMVSDVLDGSTGKPRKKGPYRVWPSIKTSKTGYKDQSYQEANKSGEVFEFKKAKKAQKFASGSWKKGRDRREAMKAYRDKNKQ